MSLPFRFGELTVRFANVRAWAEKAVGSGMNRCAICMGYTLQIAPSAEDGSVAALSGVEASVTAAGPIKAGPSPRPAVGGAPGTPYGGYFFIRAAELLPRVLRAYGPPDVQGRADQVWPRVMGQKGVIYLENCYQTDGDKRLSAIPWLYQPSSGDHWDLFDGFALVAEKISISGNTHKGTLNFWRAL
jgi:hypothetical protein